MNLLCKSDNNNVLKVVNKVRFTALLKHISYRYNFISFYFFTIVSLSSSSSFSSSYNNNYYNSIRTGNYTIYGVTLPDDASAQLKIITVFTNLLEPFPAEITQLENQFIRLKNSHYFYSPYRTDSQKTTIKLSSSSVQSFTKLSPFSTKGSNIQFGPYENINPFTVSKQQLYYYA